MCNVEQAPFQADIVNPLAPATFQSVQDKVYTQQQQHNKKYTIHNKKTVLIHSSKADSR